MMSEKNVPPLFLAISLLLVGNAQAHGQFQECIGAYDLMLPGRVEFALFPEAYLVEKKHTNEAVFSNGYVATDVRFFPGNYVGVMAAPKVEALQSLRSKLAARMEKHKQRLKDEGDEDIALAQTFYNLQRPNSFSIKGVSVIHHYEWIKGNIYYFGFERGKLDENIAELKEFLHDFHVRAVFDVPNADRICMPYADVKMPLDAERNLSVAMMVVDHPEIEILFQDTLQRVTKYSEKLYSAEHQLTYYWERRNHRGDSKVNYDWPKFENISIDGMTGKSTAVTLSRTGGSKDRGYAAYANSERDGVRRELMLIVTRNSSRALGKPMSTDEFDKLAESIAKSIRRRVQ